MQKRSSKIDTPHVQKLRALCALSDVSEPTNFDYLVSFVKEASDPETAVRGVMNNMNLPSDVLERKWRDTIIDLWASYHPNVRLLPALSLSAGDIKDTPFLKDARVFISELEKRPVSLIREHDEWLIDPTDVLRIARKLPSFAGKDLYAIESEWGNLTVRRLRAVLQVTRLIRPMKGKLVAVQSRVSRFKALPLTQQFYILWHADTYHIDWTRFSGLWEHYMQSVQEFLPLLWEAISGVEAGRIEDRAIWAMRVLDTFSSVWDDDGLLDIRPGHTVALRIVQQHALPTIVDRFILRDLFERHGLVTLSEEFGMISKFTWTKIGQDVITAEGSHAMPCGLDILVQ